MPDDGAAHEDALQIIQDLKWNNDGMWIGWTVEVTEGVRQVWLIPFIGAQ